MYDYKQAVERADFYVAISKMKPVLLNDYKLNSFPHAYRETIAYVVCIMEKSNDYFCVLLGLVLTQYQATLLVCVGQDGSLLVIDMFPDIVQLADAEAF